MSQQGRGKQGGRGGGGGGKRGGGGQAGRPTEPSGGHGPKPEKPSPPDMSKLSLGPSISAKVAVDGSPLEMAVAKPAPTGNPIPGNCVDPKIFDKILKGLSASKLQVEFPLRQAFSIATTTVYTNHFAIKLDPEMPLYEYEIKGLPDRVGRKTSRILVQTMIDNNEFLKSHQDEFATDLKESIVSWVKIPKKDLTPGPIFSREGQDPVSLWIKDKGQLKTDLLQEYAEGKAQPNKLVSNEIRSVNKALNMVISKSLSRDSFSLKANKFFITGGHTPLSISLCTMRGYFYSIKPGMGQILLNLNACTSAFFQPILVSEFLLDEGTIKNRDERKSVLRGLRIHLTYDPKYGGNEKRSRAATIEARMKTIEGTGLFCSEQTFPLKQAGKPDEKVTVKQHFLNAYGKTLLHGNLPAINCGTAEKPLWYPPEVLRILPYQIYKRKVPDAVAEGMLEIACRKPADTRALIEHEGLRELGLNPTEGFAPFSACPPIHIDSRILQIPAAVLRYPTPNYGANGSVSWSDPKQAKDGKWNLSGRKFFRANAQSPFRVCMIVVRRTDGTSLQNDVLTAIRTDFFTAAQQTYAVGKFTFVEPIMCSNFTEGQVAYQVMAMAKNRGANFIMLVLENKSTTAYSLFKDLADRTFDVHSLCIVYKGKPFGHQYWGNVMMKVNLKAGGINHTVPEVSTLMKDTLVLGADVTHPGTSSLLGTPSIAAIVGSVDQHGGKFLGSMRLQPRDTACEDIKDVEGMVVERIKDFFKFNGRVLPKNILYYRDGVSDSQYSQVKEKELPQIRKAFAAAAKSLNVMVAPKFKLTAVVVAKRHHVGFYPLSDCANDAMPKNGNCKPGTLIDTAVTSPYFQDFYLQSHNGIKGTAKSAHYFVLLNEMGMKESKIQEFSHGICYTYVRATMGVSYASPAYYADRLCDRGRHYLRNFLAPPPNSDLSNGHKGYRSKLDKEHKKKRDTKYSSKRTVDKKGRTVKSAEEKEQEDEDKESVDKGVKEMTLEKAGKAFYSQGLDKNPWKDNIGQTMFWM